MGLRLIKTDRGYGELPPRPEDHPRSRYDEMYIAWKKYHKKHPEVYREICNVIERLHKAGKVRMSMSLIFGAMRYLMTMKKAGPDEFKLNNNLMRFYVDLWRKHHPHRPDFFVTRKQPSKNKPPTDKPELGPKDYPAE